MVTLNGHQLHRRGRITNIQHNIRAEGVVDNHIGYILSLRHIIVLAKEEGVGLQQLLEHDARDGELHGVF